jgi:hypothetical protein
MALGRIKRTGAAIKKASKGAKRGPSIQTWLGRSSSGRYSAYACLGMGSAKSKPARHERCSRGVSVGRTPQAALAKAVKSLSQVMARRGKRGRK